MKLIKKIISLNNQENIYDKETREYWELWYFQLIWFAIVFVVVPLITFNGLRYLVYDNFFIATTQFLMAVTLLVVFLTESITNELKIHISGLLFLILGVFILIFTPLSIIGFLVLFLDVFSLTILMKKYVNIYLGVIILVYGVLTVLLLNNTLQYFEINNNKDTWLVSVLIVIFTNLIVIKSLNDILGGISEKSKELKVEKNFFANVISSIDEIVVTVNHDLTILQANSLFEVFFNGKVIGKKITEVVYIRKEIDGNFFPLTKMTLSQLIQHKTEELLYLEIDNKKIFVDIQVSLLRDLEMEIGYVIIFRDISLKVEKERQLMYLSNHDGLTGLYNRGFMEKQLKVFEIDSFLPIACIVGDINGLKMTNDVFGHYQGDGLLQLISNELKQYAPKRSIIGRWGGDEFLILVPNTSEEEIVEYIKNVRDSKPNFSFLRNMQVKELLSVGYDIKMNNSHTLEYHFQLAESKMYHSKLHDSKVAHNLIIEKMASTLCDFNIETVQHIQRVKDLSLDIVKYLELDESEINKLLEFIQFHDIGKIATASDLIKLKENNEDIPFDTKVKHSEIGYQITKTSGELINISYLILTHHERWDGTGYPLGLSGRGIPYLSRIFRVAHDFDTLLYGGFLLRPHSIEEVIEFFKNNSMKIYDPEFTTILLDKIIPQQFNIENEVLA